MLIIVDSEGDPIQEWSALAVDEEHDVICDVFHAHVSYPYAIDYDWFARRHVHGLRLDFLSKYGFSNVNILLENFLDWLQPYNACTIYANAPSKESSFLSRHITDAGLLPWKDRSSTLSHNIAMEMKFCKVAIADTVCFAHNEFVSFKSKRRFLNETDIAKMVFRHHCSLYDCVEIYEWLKIGK